MSGAPADIPAGMSRGEYLAKAADCIACHTAPGGKPYAGGRAFKLPFGTIYSTNLTSDRQYGIGGMSDDAFVSAVRSGVGSRGHLYPAMPYTSYGGLSREDVIDIKRYLTSIPLVHQAPPENELSFPFNQRWGMAFWNLAFVNGHPSVTDDSRSIEWNRGAYLATALGHCGECHTPRNVGMAMDTRDYLSGAEIEGWKAYNTTSNDAYGLGAWTDEQIAAYLSTGHAPGRSSAAGPMGEVVENSLQYLSATDISALVTYLRGVSPRSDANQSTVEVNPEAALHSTAVLPADNGTSQPNLRGKRLFESDCTGCHQWNGKGRQTDFASLSGSHAVNDVTGAALTRIVLKGGQITVGGRTQMMPGFGDVYSDADVAAVANYVIAHFGSKQGVVTVGSVSKQRAQ
jgi:mono/diheme cytochrome c family protein